MLPINSDYVYAIRTCDFNFKSRNGFVWPKSGVATAPDWENDTHCGHGLHACVLGDRSSNFGHMNSESPFSKFLVLKILKKDIVDLGGKIKFPKCEVIFSGDRHEFIEYLIQNLPHVLRRGLKQFNSYTPNPKNGISVVTRNNRRGNINLERCSVAAINCCKCDILITENTTALLEPCQNSIILEGKNNVITVMNPWLLNTVFCVIRFQNSNNSVKITSGIYFSVKEGCVNNIFITKNNKVVSIPTNLKIDTLYKICKKGKITEVKKLS